MKSKILLIIFLQILSFNLLGQKTVKVKYTLSNGDKEEYYVLKDNANIFEGKFVLKNSYGQLKEIGVFHDGQKNGYWKEYNYGVLKESGFYKNGKRDSLWNEYYNEKIVETGYYQNDLKNGMWIGTNYSGNYVNGVKDGPWKESTSSGSYKNGEMIGEWIYYNSDSTKNMVFNRTTKEIIWFDTTSYPKNNNKYKIFTGNDSENVILDRPPFFIGGTYSLLPFILKTVRYPQIEKQNNTIGTVYVAFEIDTNGNAINFRIYKSVSPGLDKEALRVLSLTTNNWTPGIYLGKRVQVTMFQPVKFVLN